MSQTITAIYEHGVLRPLAPLSLPEHAQVQLQIITPPANAKDERDQVRQTLQTMGVIQIQPPLPTVSPVSEAELSAVATALAQAGPLSELILAERDGR